MLRRFLYDAAFWDPTGEHPAFDDDWVSPELSRYVDGWGRPGDAGTVAEDEQPLGAAWYRLFDADGPGYGFVAPDIPELSIAVDSSARGRGVGTELLRAVIETAAREGHEALSLSVNMRNPAKRLYERLGFRGMRGSQGSVTMILRRLA